MTTNTRPKQHIVFPTDEREHFEPWIDLDSWSTELAVKLIVLGTAIKSMDSWREGLPPLPEDFETATPWQWEEYWSMNEAYQYGLEAFRSAVAIGIVQASDTPANWIKYAINKGYETAHIDRFLISRTEPISQPSEQIKSSEHAAGFEASIKQGGYKFGGIVPPQDHDRPTQTEILYLSDLIARWDVQAQGQYTAKKLETKVRQLISDGEKTPFKLFGLGIGKKGEDSAVSDGTWNNWCSKARRLHDNSR